jgi:hypothetical protein
MANSQRGNTHYVDSDGQLRAGQGRIIGVQVVGGSAATRLRLYDGDAATDPFLFDSGDVAANDGEFFGPLDIQFHDGIFADITTTGGYAFVYLR